MFSIRIRNLFYFSDSEKKTETLQHQQLRVVEITFQFIARLSHRRRVTVAYIHTYIHTPRSALGCDSMSVCLSVGLNEVIFKSLCVRALMPECRLPVTITQVDKSLTSNTPNTRRAASTDIPFPSPLTGHISCSTFSSYLYNGV